MNTIPVDSKYKWMLWVKFHNYGGPPSELTLPFVEKGAAEQFLLSLGNLVIDSHITEFSYGSSSKL